MGEVALTKADLEGRTARWGSLDVIATQKGHDLPQAAADLIWSRRLMPVLTREDATANPFGTQAPIRGAGDLTITYAECPPGTGPGLHSHKATFETFTVMQGRFAFTVSATGEEADAVEVVLDRFDAFSVPPGWHRGFRNISDETGLLQVLITGGVHDRNDIVFPPSIGRAVAAYGEDCVRQFQEMGLAFEGTEQGGTTQ